MSDGRELEKSRMIRMIELSLAIILLLIGIPAGVARHAKAADSFNDRISYYYYMQQYKDAIRPEEEIIVDVTSFTQDTSGKAEIYHNRENSETGLYVDSETAEVTFPIEVPESGLYNIELTYYPFDTSDSQIMLSVLIDGKLPFTEANSCVLSRVYQNGQIAQDEEGNDIRPRAVQVSEWRTQFLYDQTGINGNLSFYLEKGAHDITLCFEEVSLLLEQMRITQEPYVLSYQDYISIYKQKGYTDTENVQEVYQAEDYYLQSSSVLWPEADRSSPLTQPFEYTLTKINYGGGSQWKTPGQWISWKIEVPEDGFYNIGIKYKQGYLDGLFSSRKIYIDGEVPFEELNSVRFNYATQWENMLLGNEYEPYSIYLTKGEHIITMENVIGDMSSTMEVLQTSINNLNELYLSIIMITGSEPDKYRDYYLQTLLPELPEQLRENAELLFEEAERLIDVVGTKGKETAFFEDIAYDLISYAENITDLTHKGRISELKNNITSLSSKMTEYQEQALDIDYIVVTSANVEMPRVKLTAWEWITYQVKSFMASFEKTEEKEETESIRVWMGGGSDQYEILQRMITDLFTPEYGIEIELELVSGSLVQAVVAGTGPDVYIGIGGDQIVNMAIRGALEELDGYEGYQELLDEYVEGSDIPFTLEGRVYGIPNTGSFNMMFVRTDVFSSLGLKIPTTWGEVYDVAQVLQRNNMSLGVVPGFVTLLYQKGGSYYNEELTEVLFDSDVAVEAFTQYTEFYTKYDFPLSFDFTSRFRTGEMPIAISSYGTYNTLKYSAPEISGLWEMYPIPGTIREDGSVDYTQAAGAGAGTVMLKSAENKDAAWNFIQWWSGAEAQERYAKDLEAAMGVSARYATLNEIVFEKIGWTGKEYQVLSEGMQYLRFTPIVCGDYYVGRGVDNTFRAVVYDGENVRELLNKWTIRINEELARKRKEFYQNN